MTSLTDRRRAALVLCAALACGCGADSQSSQAAPDAQAQAAAPLDGMLLAELTEAYPRLGAEPLPPPKPSPDAAPGRRPNLPGPVLETVSGEATFYADRFEGRRTASGIPFRQNQMVAAHRAYPFGTVLRVTNLRNDRSVNVRVVDRGPHGSIARARRTIIDLSRRAAAELGYLEQGRTPVRVEVLEWGRGIEV